MTTKRWAIGVTTVAGREELLDQTLRSLDSGGFSPKVFRDEEPKLGIHGRWITALWELFIRDPECYYYAMFQDDLLCVRNLRQYLEANPWPETGYANLFTTLDNEPSSQDVTTGWRESGLVDGSDPNRIWQTGRGAVAIAFTRDAVFDMLSARHFAEKCATPRGTREKRLDGAIVTAMNKAGRREHVHSPSLVQHTGIQSALYPGLRRNIFAKTFPGVEFDSLSLLPVKPPISSSIPIPPPAQV